MTNFLRIAALMILGGAISPMFSQPPIQGIKNVFWQPNELQEGSVALITVELERVPLKVTGKWIGKNLAFFRSDNPKIWYALGGADLETQPGTYDLTLEAVMVGGRVIHSLKKTDIGAANFRSGAVDVPENFVEPDAKSKKQIAADALLKNRAFSHLISAPQWSGDFVTPVQAKPTDSFGMTHIFNEELSSTHRGTDFPVNEGAPVVASNSGTVVLARELFYEGNCVIVDHGQRFFTIYMHLSKIEAKVGDKLGKGDRLGLSGQTGRVTGPHLHMGVRWNGAYLDPTKLLALTLPRLNAAKRTATRANQSHHIPDYQGQPLSLVARSYLSQDKHRRASCHQSISLTLGSPASGSSTRALHFCRTSS
jgi:murein DD-endopeptidase MepM/ murein hydrolase activator NlpD